MDSVYIVNMTTQTLNYTSLIERETALEKRRASALARQQWAVAIELEARIDECKLWRKKLAEVEPPTMNKIVTEDRFE